MGFTYDRHFQLTNAVDQHQQTGFIIDVKVRAMVTGDGDWKARWNANKTALESHTLTQAEDEKFHKHENSYSAVSYVFSLLFWAVLAVLAPRQRDFCVLWLFWNFHSMMVSLNVLA